jgi:hypothetical protein
MIEVERRKNLADLLLVMRISQADKGEDVEELYEALLDTE